MSGVFFEGLPDRMARQFAFLNAIDKLKSVERRNYLADGSRRENTAEHSWHVTVMALVLSDGAKGLDQAKLLGMLLLHDIVEVDAGDTFCYDDAAHADKEAREQAAARRLFGLLPDDQAQALRGLWDEFEAGETAEARLARALDRINPFILNFLAGGGSWKEHGVKEQQILKRMDEVRTGMPDAWPLVLSILDRAKTQGWVAG